MDLAIVVKAFLTTFKCRVRLCILARRSNSYRHLQDLFRSMGDKNSTAGTILKRWTGWHQTKIFIRLRKLNRANKSCTDMSKSNIKTCNKSTKMKPNNRSTKGSLLAALAKVVPCRYCTHWHVMLNWAVS